MVTETGPIHPALRGSQLTDLVDDAIDALDIGDIVYHDLAFSRPLVDELLERVAAETPPGGRVLLVGPHCVFALALKSAGYQISIIKFGEAYFPDELLPFVITELSEDDLVNGVMPFSGTYDTVVLARVFEHRTDSPAHLLHQVRLHLVANGRIIVVLLHLARFGSRLRMLMGRDFLPSPDGVNLQLPGGWPRAKLRHLYTANEIVGYAQAASCRAMQVKFVEGLQEYLPPLPLSAIQYAFVKVKSAIKRSVPSLRDHAIITLAPLEADTSLASLVPSSDAPESEYPFLSVVVPTRDRADLLPHALDALFAQDYPADRFEIIVINDGSIDNTAAIIAEYAPKAPCSFVTHTADGIGAAAGRNLGSRIARGVIVAHTDDDCRVPPGWLRAGMRGFEQNVAFVCGPIYPDTRDEWSFFTFVMWQPNDNGTYPTSNIFYRKDVFMEAGQFEERFGANLLGRPMWGWDSDLAWRLRRKGYQRQFREDAWSFSHIFPVTPKRWLLEGWRASMLPGVVHQVPELRKTLLRGRIFLSPDTALYELGLIGTLLSLLTHRPLLLLLWGPWLKRTAGRARGDWFPPARWIKFAVKMVFMFAQAAVFAVSVIYGSILARRLVL